MLDSVNRVVSNFTSGCNFGECEPVFDGRVELSGDVLDFERHHRVRMSRVGNIKVLKKKRFTSVYAV
jgi:hypothetical protein